MSLPATIPEYTGNPVLDQFHHAKKGRDERKRRAARRVPQEPFDYHHSNSRAADRVVHISELESKGVSIGSEAQNLPIPKLVAYSREARGRRLESLRRERQEKEAEAIEKALRKAEHERRFLAELKCKTMRQIALETVRKYQTVLDASMLDVYSERRTAGICFVRHEIWYRCKTETLASLPAIARHFRRKDHTTILHGHQQYQHYQRAKRGEDTLSKYKQAWVPLHMVIDPEAV